MYAYGIEYKIYSKSETEIDSFINSAIAKTRVNKKHGMQCKCGECTSPLFKFGETADELFADTWEKLPVIEGQEGRKAYAAKFSTYERADLLLLYMDIIQETLQEFPDIGLTTFNHHDDNFEVEDHGYLIRNIHEAAVVSANDAVKSLGLWMAGI